MPKRKADCAPEEWALIREKARAYDKKQRAKPERKQYMQEYMADYMRTDIYREKDNARYDAKRREGHLARHRQRAYGASDQLVTLLRDLQGNRCAVCKADFGVQRADKRYGPECLDHCHTSGQVRGLLCRMCNTIEGFFLKKGLTPAEFGAQMQAYLDNPPARLAQDAMELAG